MSVYRDKAPILWGIYRRHRADGLPVPDYVLDYFDHVAERLLALVQNPPERVDVAVLRALELDRPGRGSAFADANIFSLACEASMRVSQLKERKPTLTNDRVYDLVAEGLRGSGHKIKKATVRKYYEKITNI